MKYITHILLISSLLAGAGCKGFLDEENKRAIPAHIYYQSPENYDKLINACYGGLRPIYDGKPHLFNSGTDLYIEALKSNTSGSSALGQYSQLFSNNGDVKDFYTRCYIGIGTVNAALYYGESTEHTDLLPRQLAEARFLRAFFYFHLVQQFGGVPIVREMATEPAFSFPRDSEQDVYKFIIDELEDLINDLPESYDSENYGRVNRRVVRFFLAKAYLTRGWTSFGTATDFQQAKSYADQAIANQHLTLAFADAYKVTDNGYRNEEVIWSIIYSPNSLKPGEKNGNIQSAIFGPDLGEVTLYQMKPSSCDFVVGLYGHYVFSKDIADPNNDTRYYATFTEKIYETYNTMYTKTPAQLDNSEIRFYYPAWWDSSFTDEATWKAVDPTNRQGATVTPIMPAAPPDPETDRVGFLEAAGRSGFLSHLGVNQKAILPSFRKFDCVDASFISAESGTRDVDIARLSEAYLIAAEALIKQDRATDAVPYINEVRKRAILAGDAQREIGAGKATIDFILDERARELMGQYDRWYDLKRTGTLIERSVKYNPDLQNDPLLFVGPDGNNKILRPIPQAAIDLNTAGIQQNPGY